MLLCEGRYKDELCYYGYVSLKKLHCKTCTNVEFCHSDFHIACLDFTVRLKDCKSSSSVQNCPGRGISSGTFGGRGISSGTVGTDPPPHAQHIFLASKSSSLPLSDWEHRFQNLYPSQSIPVLSTASLLVSWHASKKMI